MKHAHDDKYKELVKNLNDAVYTVDASTLIFNSANDAAERMTGYKQKELLGMNITRVIAPEYLSLVRKMIGLKRKKKPTIYEIEVVRKDGSRIPIEISSRATYSKGKPIEIIGIARDITERKLLERQRNLFLGLITHEVKNPLTSVNLYLSLLTSEVQHDTKTAVYVSSMAEQIKSIDRIMTDFLDVSKMGIGKFHIKKEPVDLSATIKEVLAFFIAPHHRITFKSTVAKKVPADKARIKQVLVNLLSNAVKYSPEGTRIIVSVMQDKKCATVCVKDFGEGMSKTDQRHIFDPFVRTSAALQKNIHGHGLGLYICHEIVKRHGGKLWVESEQGKGSEFRFTIPFASRKR